MTCLSAGTSLVGTVKSSRFVLVSGGESIVAAGAVERVEDDESRSFGEHRAFAVFLEDISVEIFQPAAARGQRQQRLAAVEVTGDVDGGRVGFARLARPTSSGWFRPTGSRNRFAGCRHTSFVLGNNRCGSWLRADNPEAVHGFPSADRMTIRPDNSNLPIWPMAVVACIGSALCRRNRANHCGL